MHRKGRVLNSAPLRQKNQDHFMKQTEAERVKWSVTMEPIGFVHHNAGRIPRHWTVSDVQGTLIIHEKYLKGLKDIKAGQRIVVIFFFHQSPEFDDSYLTRTPRHRKKRMGVFSICSPVRPNPIGMSVLEVLGVKKNVIYVKGLDMFDGTPILDIKPYIKDKHDCPSFDSERRRSSLLQ
jgi:tRNA-Thr(GGU) m(6)t(6)A37 methyltransferase TsaA